MNYYDLATRRKSTRDYKNKDVPEDLLRTIEDYSSECTKLFPEIKTDCLIIHEEAGDLLEGCAGYHGFMVDAPYYLLLLTEDCPFAYENAGYMGEDLVLKMTELGLGSCWLTVLDSDKLKENLKLKSSKVAACLIAFGYEKSEIGGFRLDIKSPSLINLKKRTGQIAPKLFIEDAIYDGDWGRKIDLSGWAQTSNLYRAFIAACCSPSALNRQPYRFILDGNLVSLVVMKDELTSEDNEKLNVGIVMHHFQQVLCQRTSVSHEWKLGAPERTYALPEGASIVGCIET